MGSASARHHAEWLSLIEISGPFLSIPVLERVYPQGLDAHEPDHYRELRLAHEEWGEKRSNAAIHRAWIKVVLQQTLAFPDEVLAEGQAISSNLSVTMHKHGSETIRPDFLIKNPDGVPNAGKARMLIQVFPAGQDLRSSIPLKHWKASPETRMVELLHATDVRLGLVTNGEQWMLVNAARGETSGFTSWYADLWFQEQITLRAFRSVLGVGRFFSAADSDILEALLIESATNQQEVTDQLGIQVRHAVEVLIQSLDRADQDHGGRLLADVSEATLYEAALTVMMRLVFLFSAEERGLLLLGDELYDENYAVSTLVAQLQKAADEDTEDRLERKFDGWVRLLTTFRVVFGGVRHDRMTLIPYSGQLFDPDRFPFLEGRKAGSSWRDTPATPLPINNRTVLHLLRSLQFLQMHGEARRLSFRALGVEQIGHVYEGLLDHTAKRADAPMLGLIGAKNEEPEVALAELQRESAKGETYLVSYLREKTKRAEATLTKNLHSPVEGEDMKKLRAVCGNNDALYQLVLPVSGLLREDTFGWPVVIRKGSVFVTGGTDRRSSGTHYTPPELTKPIVQYALEPLVYVGPAEGKPENEWKLRPAKELLDLKICDMACGSGAFLVQACRYLSERLVEAWVVAEEQKPSILGILPDGSPSTGSSGEQPVPRDENERLILARRFVAERCLYGVDKNPLAVEMAKLSLWLITLHKGQPFTFLNHAIRPGDSLLGITDIAQLEQFHIDPKRGRDLHEGLLDIRPMVRSVIEKATELRRKLESFTVKDDRDTHSKDELLKQVEASLAPLRILADLMIGAALVTAGKGDDAYDAEIAKWARQVREALDPELAEEERNRTFKDLRASAQELLDAGNPDGQSARKPFHWALEFPEVVDKREQYGFKGMIGNPPFQGGKKITGALGHDYREFLMNHVAGSTRGNSDICAFFFLRAVALLGVGANAGLVATNTIAQGDTREVGLDQIVERKYSIYRAIPSEAWPGVANLEVARVWLRSQPWSGKSFLRDKEVENITSSLTAGESVGQPFKLAENSGKSFVGSVVLGMGFVLTPDQAAGLIDRNPRNRECLFSYINGQDLNSRPDQSGSRWVINFRDWALEKAEQYPDLLSIVREKVKPERDLKKRKAYRDRWWRFAELQKAAHESIAPLDRFIATALTSNTQARQFLRPDQVIDQTIVIFPTRGADVFACLSCSLHYWWVVRQAPTMRTDLRYLPSDCFETFPFPSNLSKSLASQGLDRIGEVYHEYRGRLMRDRHEGLTKTYNRFNNPSETSSDVSGLRKLHTEMDLAVAAAYGWSDLELGHDFHQTKQGIRFTISESARSEVLDRLLSLNHERYAEEVKQGLHDKKGQADKASAKRSMQTKVKEQSLLFGGGNGNEFAGDEDGEDAGADDTSEADESEDTSDERPSINQLSRPTPIDTLETNDVMAAFRQAARGSSLVERDALLKQVATILGYQRLGKKVEESLRNQLRAAIRRRIIEPDGATMVRAGASTMADYDLEELRECFRSVMTKGRRHEREEVIPTLAHYLGFSRVTDSIRDPIKSAITSAIRQGILGYEGSLIWREE